MSKKKRPNLTVIEGGKVDPPPTPEPTTSSLDYLMATLPFLTSDLFVIPLVDTSSLTTSNWSTERPIDHNTWIELSALVDRWRDAKDEFTLMALNQDLRNWLNRR